MSKIATKDAIVTDPAGIQRQVYAGQTIPTELLDAYEKSGAEATDQPPRRVGRYIGSDGEEHDLPIAQEDAVVHDEARGIDRQVLAGQPVPPDLLDAYEKRGSSKSQRSAPRDKAHRSAQTDK